LEKPDLSGDSNFFQTPKQRIQSGGEYNANLSAIEEAYPKELSGMLIPAKEHVDTISMKDALT
jgi:hypothetical protein